MNVRLRMYQVLLFKFGRHLCKGSINEQTFRDELDMLSIVSLKFVPFADTQVRFIWSP